MVCFHPITGYRTPAGTVTFNRARGWQDVPPVSVSCGNCVGCRLERSRQWAVRCVHESKMHNENCFITLTYDDEHLPEDESLCLRHFQLFMKRFRKRYGKIRFFHCGEYGETTLRPHYHACIFGYDFPDRRLFKSSASGESIYTSAALGELWSDDEGRMLGFSTIGDVTFNSAAYVARYIMKKVNGDDAAAHYEHITRYGEVVQRRPEYVTMSRRPGIGAGWFHKFADDIYPGDFAVMNNKKFRPPRFYDNMYEHTYGVDRLEAVKSKRRARGRKRADDNTPLRLKTRERVQKARLKLLKRDLE